MEQTPEQMEAAAAGPRSPALEYANPSAPRMPASDSLEEMFKDAGANTEAVAQDVQAQQVKDKQSKFEQFHKEMESIERERANGKAREAVGQVALGVGLGFRDIAKNTYNGVVSLANSAEDFAASNGFGAGDLITEANKWDDAYGQQAAKDLGAPGEVTRSVVNFAGPLLATMGSGGSFALGMGVNAAYNFLAVDPKQSRVSDHLKGTFMSEVPVAADVIDYLSNKPDDTELEGRFKNMFEGMGMDAAIGGMLWGASRAYTGIKNLRSPKALIGAEQEVVNTTKAVADEKAALAANPEGVASAESGSLPVNDPNPPLPPVEGQAAKAAEEVKPPTIEETIAANNTPEQLGLFEQEWARTGIDEAPITTNAEGATRITLANDEIIEKFYAASKNVDQNVLRTPMTDTEMLEAADLMKNDPDVIERLATWSEGKPLPTDKETIVLKYVMQQGDASYREAVSRVVANPDDPVSMIRFMRETENYMRLNDIRQGTASAKAASLRAEKVIANLARAGQKEAMAMMGAQGRANLVEKLVESYGGKGSIGKMATEMDYLSRMAAIAEVPDSDFAFRMGSVVQKTGWMRIEDAVTKVALNGMLSSPMTSGKALLTNMVTTGKTVIDNYISAGWGKMASTDGARTLEEANAHLKGVMSGLYEGIQPAWNVLKNGTAEKSMRMDLAQGIQKVVDQDDAMFKASGAWASKMGAAVEAVDATVGMPTRVLMSVDTYWNRVNYNGAINAAAVKSASKAGLVGEAFDKHVAQFVAKPPASADFYAEQLAQTNTMAKNLTGLAENLDDAIGTASEKYIPFGRVILPFFKTNANLVEYTVQNSPLASMFSNDFRMAIKQGGRAKDDAIAKVISGTTIIGGMAGLAQAGKLTGRGSENPQVERALKDNKTVAPPTSIQVGDKWVSLAGIEPLATFVNMAAMGSKLAGHISREEYQDVAISMSVMAGEVATPEQMTDAFSGLLNVMNANTPEKQEDALRYLQTIPTRFVPFGGLMTDVRQTIDPATRNTRGMDFLDSVQNRFSNMVPYLSKDLPIQQNIWGEDLMLPDGLGPDAMSPIATTGDEGMRLKRALESMDDYYEQTRGTNMGLTKFDIKMPDRHVKNPLANISYEMDPHEHAAYIKLAAGINPDTGAPLRADGKTLKSIVNDVVTKYDGFDKRPQDFNPGKYAAMVGELSQVFTVYRQVANKRIFSYGDVRQHMKEQAEKFRSYGGENVAQ